MRRSLADKRAFGIKEFAIISLILLSVVFLSLRLFRCDECTELSGEDGSLRLLCFFLFSYQVRVHPAEMVFDIKTNAATKVTNKDIRQAAKRAVYSVAFNSLLR